jgi:hypothetical protein
MEIHWSLKLNNKCVKYSHYLPVASIYYKCISEYTRGAKRFIYVEINIKFTCYGQVLGLLNDSKSRTFSGDFASKRESCIVAPRENNADGTAVKVTRPSIDSSSRRSVKYPRRWLEPN